MKYNLDNVEVYTSIDKSSCQVVNLRKDIANLVYNRGNGLGLEGTALATKMWNGNSETEYNERDGNHPQAGGSELCSMRN